MTRTLPALLLLGCAKHPPMGDPDLQKLLSMKALDEAASVSACLRRDGVRASLNAEVQASTGRVVSAKVQTDQGEQNAATECLAEAIGHWLLDPPLSGSAGLIFADDAAEQDARTARDEVGRVAAAHEAAIAACHQVAADRTEGLPPSGLVLLAWTIDHRKAVGAKVMSNDTGDAELARCLVAEVERWSFPAEAVGAVDWPFSFTGTGPAK